ncbi:MAG: DEAD/DEAH box helicase [Paludibaculum sp.]
MIALPVDALIPSILESLRTTPNLVLEAPPGAGKTTRVPAALLGALTGQILVLEPRRLAARLAARRVASELGEQPGQTVGYQVRFEQVGGPATRLKFLTEGVLTRQLLSDPDLKNVDAVILDEFHERHLEGDLALSLLHRLQQTRRPDLRLVVMSATLHGEPISAFLGGCPVLRSDGRLFDLSVAYTPHSADALETQVAEAVETLVKDQSQGDILVFLPGAAEIRRSQRSLQKFATIAACWCCRCMGICPRRTESRCRPGRPAEGDPLHERGGIVDYDRRRPGRGGFGPGADPEGQSVDRVGAH